MVSTEREERLSRRIGVSVGLAAGVLAIAVVPDAFAQNTPSQPRTVTYVPGRPITSVVETGDADVMIVSLTSPGLRVEAARGTSEIDWETRLADAVLTLRVEGKRTTVTERGDWLQTTVSAIVTEVLKLSPKKTIAVGEHLTFVIDGGETTLTLPVRAEPVHVHADVPWAIPFEVGSAYLVFGWIPDNGKLVVTPDVTYALMADGYVWSLVRGRPTDELNGTLAARALDRIRALVGAGRGR